ncbi:hypothetical protein A0J51_03265 [Gluconobacter japonicus]|nr:hypothetical protein A0J51_03265 [Gluconobacter japonicus]
MDGRMIVKDAPPLALIRPFRANFESRCSLWLQLLPSLSLTFG